MRNQQSPRVPTMPGSFGVGLPVQRATTQQEILAMQNAARSANPGCACSSAKKDANPRLPSMPGVFANSQLPIGASSTHRGANIVAQGIAQAEAVQATRSGSMGRAARAPNPTYVDDCGKCPKKQICLATVKHGDHWIYMCGDPPLFPKHRNKGDTSPRSVQAPQQSGMPRRSINPMYHSGSVPGSYGIPSPGLSDYRGRQAPSYATSVRALHANPMQGFGPLQRFQGSLDQARQQHYAVNPTALRAAQLQARASAQGQGGHSGPQTLNDLCPPGTHFNGYKGCVPNPPKRTKNPPPKRRSTGPNDVQVGVYHPTGAEVFFGSPTVAQAQARALSAKHGGATIKIRSYRGDGRGGWTPGVLSTVQGSGGTIAERTKAKIQRGVSQARKAANPGPGCASCMGKMAYMPQGW